MGLPVVGLDLPDVPECSGFHHLSPSVSGTCAQCDGRHTHQWVDCFVVHSERHPDLAHRCRVCGGRRCDQDCLERRHHRGPHLSPAGELWQVGK